MRNSSLDRERRRKDSVESHTLAMRVKEVRNPGVELALDSIGRQFGEQGMMPDYQKFEICPEKDSPDLMSDIEGLHHCWESKKQYVQGGLTKSD